MCLVCDAVVQLCVVKTKVFTDQRVGDRRSDRSVKFQYEEIQDGAFLDLFR